MLSLTTLSPPPHLLLSLPCFPSRLLASSLCFVGTQFTPQRLQPWAAFRWASLALINCQRYLTKSRMENFELAASQGQDPVVEAPPTLKPTRRVIEHVTLFQMNEDFSKDQATVMLDYLYTMQYQMRGIIAVSLGYVNNNAEGCTHASVMRFPSVETLKAYYEHPIRTMITNEYIIPYQHEFICVDYEADVQDDIMSIFRRGEEFERGVENVMFLKVKEGIGPGIVQQALRSLSDLIQDFGSLVVQHTAGTNFGNLNKDYTHGMITRFPSEEAKTIFTQHPSFLEVMENKVFPMSSKVLSVDFAVEPIGTTVL
eukprot:c24948_g1_i8 orf=196-1134(+)